MVDELSSCGSTSILHKDIVGSGKIVIVMNTQPPHYYTKCPVQTVKAVHRNKFVGMESSVGCNVLAHGV